MSPKNIFLLTCTFPFLCMLGCHGSDPITVKGTAHTCPLDKSSQVLGLKPPTDMPNSTPLQGVNVRFLRIDNGRLIGEALTDSNGVFSLALTCESGTNLRVIYSKDGFDKCEMDFTIGFMSNFLDSYARMSPTKELGK